MTDESYISFKAKYNISLNEQQEKAVQAIDGPTLLLAVPGSGKTTVLVTRLGYMVLEKGISPRNILSITYTKAATRDMRSRFAAMFGSELANQMCFKTINSVSEAIVKNHSLRSRIAPLTLLSEEKQKTAIIRDLIWKIRKEYPLDIDVMEVETKISYIKNMMLTDEEITKLEEKTPNIKEIYYQYKATLLQKRLMDFDDQLVFALAILQKNPIILKELQQEYQYICVDEAQDTSKIQHEIIRLLAKKNKNIFMVGDEDQSIYGFRAAYPQALLDFKKNYSSPNILYMEKNYRSTVEIIDKAANFIKKNEDRYDKRILPVRGNGAEVKQIAVNSLIEQYQYMLDVAKNKEGQTAILYRDNDSIIPLVDLLFREGVPFKLSQNKGLLFSNRITLDMFSFLRLAINPYDVDSFMQIYFKCGFPVNKQTAIQTVERSQNKRIPVLDALVEELGDRKTLKQPAIVLRNAMKSITKMHTRMALDEIIDFYQSYMMKNLLDKSKLDILDALAVMEPTIDGFLRRMYELQELLATQTFNSPNGIILSTVHSAKGLEYENVYIISVSDGLFPIVDEKAALKSEEDRLLYQEERRLFYVALTRAKSKLFVVKNNAKTSAFNDELFLLADTEEEKKTEKKPKKKASKKGTTKKTPQKLSGYDEVKDLFVQQTEQIRDSQGVRWVKCEICGEIKPEAEFNSYGGANHVNLGVCSACHIKESVKTI